MNLEVIAKIWKFGDAAFKFFTLGDYYKIYSDYCRVKWIMGNTHIFPKNILSGVEQLSQWLALLGTLNTVLNTVSFSE